MEKLFLIKKCKFTQNIPNFYKRTDNYFIQEQKRIPAFLTFFCEYHVKNNLFNCQLSDHYTVIRKSNIKDDENMKQKSEQLLPNDKVTYMVNLTIEKNLNESKMEIVQSII